MVGLLATPHPLQEIAVDEPTSYCGLLYSFHPGKSTFFNIVVTEGFRPQGQKNVHYFLVNRTYNLNVNDR